MTSPSSIRRYSTARTLRSLRNRISLRWWNLTRQAQNATSKRCGQAWKCLNYLRKPEREWLNIWNFSSTRVCVLAPLPRPRVDGDATLRHCSRFLSGHASRDRCEPRHRCNDDCAPPAKHPLCGADRSALGFWPHYDDSRCRFGNHSVWSCDPAKGRLAMELSVGLMLILLGIVNLTGIMRWIGETVTPSTSAQDSHPHEHGGYVHGHPHVHSPEKHGHAEDATPVGWMDRTFGRLGVDQIVRPLAVGIVHGLAGSAAVAL